MGSLCRSAITVVVFTKEFMRNAFSKYANVAAFGQLLEYVASSTPRYIPVGVGLRDEEFPSAIQASCDTHRYTHLQE